MRISMALLAGIALAFSGVGVARAQVTLTGSGATFPKPLYEKWIGEYTKARPDVKINYTGKGSGGGIKDFTDKTVDFGATDGPMTARQLEKLKGEAYHLPMTMGAVVPIYNLPEAKKTLVFSGPVLADLFLGKIKKWNDPKLVALNPDAGLPDKAVTIVHRSDGSGTSYVFTDYLAKVSPEFKKTVGCATTPDWVKGQLGGKGNDGVAGEISRAPGTLGYVELLYALANKIAYGSVQNAAGKTVAGSIESVTAAAASIKEIPTDLRISITNAPGDDAYPISTFTWVLVYKQQADSAKAKALVEFLWWAVHDGQKLASELHYAPLPQAFVIRNEQRLQSITAEGKPVLTASAK